MSGACRQGRKFIEWCERHGRPKSAGHHRRRCRRKREHKIDPQSHELVLREARLRVGIGERQDNRGRQRARDNDRCGAAVAEAITRCGAVRWCIRSLRGGLLTADSIRLMGMPRGGVRSVCIHIREAWRNVRRRLGAGSMMRTHRTGNQRRARGDRRAPESPHQEPGPPIASGPSHPLSVRVAGAPCQLWQFRLTTTDSALSSWMSNHLSGLRRDASPSSAPSMADHALADAAGVAVSFACAVHCVATPVFVAFLSLVGLSGGDSPLVEWGFLGGSLVIGVLALRSGRRRHQNAWPFRAFLAGGLSLGLARWAGEARPLLEASLVVIGASAIIAAHVANWRSGRRCQV